MLIYHTSDTIVDRPDNQHSRSGLDFGRGFYATIIREQAERYAQRFTLRNHKGILNIYECSLTPDLKTLAFEAYDEQWLDFVAACRMENDRYKEYDLITGGIADDRVFNTLDLYFSNQMSKEEALKRLIYEKPNQQMCLVSQRAIDSCLTFIDYKEL